MPRGCEDAANVSFTPDGQHLLFTRATGRVRQFPRYEFDQIEHAAVATIAIEGTDEREILRLGRSRRRRVPADVPRRALILFERHNSPLRKPRMGQAICLMNADSTNVHRVTPWKLRGGDNPDWAPDSSPIVFRSQEEADAERARLPRPPRGHRLTRLTEAPHGHRQTLASFSPDGTQIVYARASDDREHGEALGSGRQQHQPPSGSTPYRPLTAHRSWGGLASSPWPTATRRPRRRKAAKRHDGRCLHKSTSRLRGVLVSMRSDRGALRAVAPFPGKRHSHSVDVRLARGFHASRSRFSGVPRLLEGAALRLLFRVKLGRL